ncbi:MAG: hypothetical protein ACOX6T_17435 [Myxococcales bacterium]
MLLRRLLLAAVLLLPAGAAAQRDTTREALARLEESLAIEIEAGGLKVKDLVPVMVVSVTPAFEESKAWYPSAALATLARVFGSAGLRACEACMAPRVYAREGRVEQLTTSPGAAEIVRLDEANRGSAPPARTAIWLDENAEGVSVRLIDLRNSRIVLAENFDPSLTERARTARNTRLAQELARRVRGDTITHTFFDMVVYPGQHFSFDWTDQWGETNRNLSGLSFSFFDPVVGVGAAYYRVIPSAFNLMVGAKVLMSVPTALVQNITGDDMEVLDPLLTGVLVARLPIGRSNYAVTFSVSTNGNVGLGLSLMNITLLPILP